MLMLLFSPSHHHSSLATWPSSQTAPCVMRPNSMKSKHNTPFIHHHAVKWCIRQREHLCIYQNGNIFLWNLAFMKEMSEWNLKMSFPLFMSMISGHGTSDIQVNTWHFFIFSQPTYLDFLFPFIKFGFELNILHFYTSFDCLFLSFGFSFAGFIMTPLEAIWTGWTLRCWCVYVNVNLAQMELGVRKMQKKWKIKQQISSPSKESIRTWKHDTCAFAI